MLEEWRNEKWGPGNEGREVHYFVPTHAPALLAVVSLLSQALRWLWLWK